MKKRTDRIRQKADGPNIRNFVVENVAYDGENGVLYLRGSPRVRIPIEPEGEHGKRPRVRIMGKAVLAAHVAYICKKKEWPTLPIKHLNGNEQDIRWDNMTLVSEPADEEEDDALTLMANNRFLDDLRKYHPKGPPTYQIKAGKPTIFHSYRSGARGFGGSPAAMCADQG